MRNLLVLLLSSCTTVVVEYRTPDVVADAMDAMDAAPIDAAKAEATAPDIAPEISTPDIAPDLGPCPNGCDDHASCTDDTCTPTGCVHTPVVSRCAGGCWKCCAYACQPGHPKSDPLTGCQSSTYTGPGCP